MQTAGHARARLTHRQTPQHRSEGRDADAGGEHQQLPSRLLKYRLGERTAEGAAHRQHVQLGAWVKTFSKATLKPLKNRVSAG